MRAAARRPRQGRRCANGAWRWGWRCGACRRRRLARVTASRDWRAWRRRWPLREIDFLPAWYTRKLRHRRMAWVQAWLAVTTGAGLICCLGVVYHGRGRPRGGEVDGRTPTTATTVQVTQTSAVLPPAKSRP